MTNVAVAEGKDAHAPWVEAHKTLLESAGAEPEWLRKKRENAIRAFNEAGFPTVKDEGWRYTNVAPLVKTRFEEAGEGVDATAADVEPYAFPRLNAACLVFVNGRYRADLSDTRGPPGGVTAKSLAEILQKDPKAAEAHLGRVAKDGESAFTALNTAFFRDGAFVEVPAGVVVEKPIHLVFLSKPGAGQATVSHPRSLIVVGENAQASVVETHAGADGAAYFSNAVTEILAAENAVVEHYKLQREGRDAFHVATLQTEQARAANVAQHNVSLGARLCRNDVNATFTGEGGHSTLNGLFVGSGTQHVDNHTRLDHAVPRCTSHEFYKGILDGKARGVFNGRILVRKDAQKTDAIQHNPNLLLSREALVDSTPQLEIYADDVKCTHGSTIGQLDEEAVFYLRSRGIPETQARRVLTYAFAADVLQGMRLEPVREALEAWLASHLAGGHIKEGGA